ncbi:hypothetical protein B0H19DRAFT_1142423 [Mycena capillaripes]|nr:hypothetical protein B0H19DRAFT_1142423 [Mycena capillaripes]
MLETDYSMLIETLIQYSSRWNRMQFKFLSYSSFSPLATLSSTDVPILDTFIFEGFQEIFQRQQVQESNINGSTLSFLGNPILRSVAFRRLGGSFLPFPLPWNRLRYLFLGQDPASWATAAEGIELLRRCPNLEACSLAFRAPPIVFGPSLPNTFHLSTCRMEYLRQLSVVDMSQATTEFLGNLDLPNLHCLEYSTWPSVWSDFPSFHCWPPPVTSNVSPSIFPIWRLKF